MKKTLTGYCMWPAGELGGKTTADWCSDWGLYWTSNLSVTVTLLYWTHK